MSRVAHGRLAAAVVAALASGVFAAVAAQADGGTTTKPATFGAETWYQPNPACPAATGCLSATATPPPTNPYGAGTLHVAVTAGSASTETARTYLSLGALPLGPGMTVVKAVFTAPLDTSAAAGSVMPNLSTTHVCTSTAALAATEGEYDSYPDTSCAVDAPLGYVATPAEELTGDLTSLINTHLADLAAGRLDLAVIPLNAPPTATWHDVFSSDDRTSAGPAAPTLVLTLSSATSGAAVDVTVPATQAPLSTAVQPAASAAGPTPTRKAVTGAQPVRTAEPPAVAPAPGQVQAVQPPVSAVVPAQGAVAPATVLSPQVASDALASPVQATGGAVAPPAQVQVAASTRTVGFAYPAVLLLPIVLIAGGVGLARVMTRDITPRRTP